MGTARLGRGKTMYEYASYADVYRQGPMAHVPVEIRPGGTWGLHLLRADQPR